MKRKKPWGGYYKIKRITPKDRYERHAEANRKAVELSEKVDVPLYRVKEITHQRPS